MIPPGSSKAEHAIAARLPPEILDLILSSLNGMKRGPGPADIKDDFRCDLSKCALVCRAWRTPSQRLQYRSFRVGADPDDQWEGGYFARFATFLESEPGLAYCIQELYLQSMPLPRMYRRTLKEKMYCTLQVTVLHRILSLTPYLKDLVLNIEASSKDDFAPAGVFPLDSLVLFVSTIELPEWEPEALTHMLAMFSPIGDLNICDIMPRSSNLLKPVTALNSLWELQHLELKAQSLPRCFALLGSPHLTSLTLSCWSWSCIRNAGKYLCEFQNKSTRSLKSVSLDLTYISSEFMDMWAKHVRRRSLAGIFHIFSCLISQVDVRLCASCQQGRL